MEAVKKKLAQLKDEKELAVERAEEAEKAKKEAEERADQVRERIVSVILRMCTFALAGCGKDCAEDKIPH